MADQKVDKEQEFICGNLDGMIPGGTSRSSNGMDTWREGPNNATYNVCRIGVSEVDLKEEFEAGLHPRTQVLGTEWLSCPAVGTLKDASDVTSLQDFAAAGLGPDPGHRLEVIRKMAGNGSYVVCRLGVPRTRMVEEVEADLHPGYYVFSRGGDKFVAAKPDGTKKNNVNEVGRPWPSDGKPEGVVCPISRFTAC